MIKIAVRLACVIAGIILAIWILSEILSPKLHKIKSESEVSHLEDYRKNFEVSLPEKPPRIQKDVDYALGKQAAWWPKGEAPILKDLVAKGILPPVEKRVGSEPLVLKGVDGIGQYGGLWLRVGNNVVTGRLCHVDLTRWSPCGYPRVMNVAKNIEHSGDWRTFTVHLRRGMRWSDGYPFTTEAVRFFMDCIKCSNDYPKFLKDANGNKAKVTIVDARTFKIEYKAPKGDFYEMRGYCYEPGHYLRQYHYKFGNPEKIKEAMNAYQLSSPRTVYSFMKSFSNPELPSLRPWIYRSYSSVDPQTYVRNPYFWAVDPQGNQLPYIDAIQTRLVDVKMLPIRAAQGESSMQARGLDFSNYTELKDKSLQSGKQDVYLWYPVFTSYFMRFSLNRYVDPNKPATKWKAKLLADKRFRQAFSLAINRKRIIKAMYYGLGKPEQMKLLAPYNKHPIKDAYTKYDPGKASGLLDELGLVKRDSEGYRLLPDGNQACFYIDNVPNIGLGPSEFIVDDLKKVGLRVISRISGNFMNTQLANDYDISTCWSGNTVMYGWRAVVGFPWRWMTYAHSGGELSPEEYRALYSGSAGSVMKLLREIELQPPDKRVPYVNKLLDYIAEEVYTISFTSPLPSPVVVSRNLRNVPKVAMYDMELGGIGITAPETYYFAKNNTTPAFKRQLASSIINPVLRPGPENGRATTFERAFSTFLKIAIPLILLVLLILLIMKFPFVLRRLLIMIPTLFIISIVSFTIVQLPPGDYLQTEIVRLSQDGGNQEVAKARIAELKEMFHYGEPMWKSYLRWSGLYWFTTFKSKDTGLLQGNLGRSMKTLRPVNSMIGERLAFTVALALAGIILGYAISWPIGIICAVRKGGFFDYLFMFIGFLAMCVPSFLLGLILMVLSGKSGLLSPEFASQPNWDWPKICDFLEHLWIPLSIMLIGCVSGGGRVLRANILDELKKPYVVTARAKGVRPLKLLLKYPVRMALNPWASGVGAIFPALIGGNAILAIVLGLPTLGPMMLEAIMNQDVYLACANLMLLSLLSVFGVLVSDIILIIVDPRIKYGKG